MTFDRRRFLTLVPGGLLAGAAFAPGRLNAAVAATAITPPAAPTAANTAAMETAIAGLARFDQLRTALVAVNGAPLAGTVFRGPPADRPVNVKSVSKTILATLVGIAIDRGDLAGVDQPVVPLLGRRAPSDADPRLARVTVGHLLAMRSGLQSTSGANYGRWVSSRDWLDFALTRPFEDEPGGRMIYSTGNSHILATVLTRVTGKSLLSLARNWLGEPLDITIPDWPADPQGVHFGGNDMALSPRALQRFAIMIANGGTVGDTRVVSSEWIAASWTEQQRSRHTGHAYGYGWFSFAAEGGPVRYAWGYGGQMVYVVPHLGLTAVMTSDPTAPSGRTGYVRELHQALVDDILPAAANA